MNILFWNEYENNKCTRYAKVDNFLFVAKPYSPYELIIGDIYVNVTVVLSYRYQTWFRLKRNNGLFDLARPSKVYEDKKIAFQMAVETLKELLNEISHNRQQ